MLINTSPEPFSNWAASFGEDLSVGTLLFLAFAYPWVAIAVLVLIIVATLWLLPRVWRAIRGIVGRIGAWFGGAAGRPRRMAAQR